MNKIIVGIFSIPLLFFYLSCATNDKFVKIDAAVAEAKYSESEERLEKDKRKLYDASRDTVLYYLDRGLLAHYSKDYEASSLILEDGERAIEDAFTKSITQLFASKIVNDSILEYPGEDYEDIYINVFNALNYYHRGDVEGAIVEIRRMHEKIRYLAAKYNEMDIELKKQADENGVDLPADSKKLQVFTDSALARYMGMLFFRACGNDDDVRIDYEGLQAAFSNNPNIYAFPLPASVSGDLTISDAKARLNVIAFSGLSPVKVRDDAQIPLPGGTFAQISFPVMISRPSQIDYIELVIHNGDKYKLELLEDIDAIARETFETRRSIIYRRAVIRGMVKGITASALSVAADKADNPLLGLFALGTQVFAAVSEQADLRLSRYFPGRASVMGVNLEQGTYSFDVIYYNKFGKVITTEHFIDIEVKQRELNLIESYSLR